MMERHWVNLQVAFTALVSNRMRSLLTALGIIFGVAAVIAMLSIGRGAKQEILEQIKLVGVNNIVISAKVLTDENGESGEEEESMPLVGKENKKASPGLTMQDVAAFGEALPTLASISPEVVKDVQMIRKGQITTSRLIGVHDAFFPINNFRIIEGQNFTQAHQESGQPVCIIGHNIKQRFFGNQNPIGKRLKAGDVWLTVVGVLAERAVTEAAITNLGLRDFNNDVYVPLKTMFLRVNDRGKVAVGGGSSTVFFGGGMAVVGDDGSDKKNKNYHQLDKVVVQVADTRHLQSTAEIIARMLERRHNGIVDFEITIPELLLAQQQRTKTIFNLVLGAIAGISLLVGGIGIMNIMLASVMERIKEIGIRMAIGARKLDIISQFLMEAVLISLLGGIIGIILGVVASEAITYFTDILTIVSAGSVIISFGISFLVGLIFGLTPARKAALQDPIESLRHE